MYHISLSTTTSVASRNLSVGSARHSIVANISPHSKKRRKSFSYAFTSNFLRLLHFTSVPFLCAVKAVEG
nr:MAG TPA: hypothetical protein [Caudoviricetes sp.]